MAQADHGEPGKDNACKLLKSRSVAGTLLSAAKIEENSTGVGNKYEHERRDAKKQEAAGPCCKVEHIGPPNTNRGVEPTFGLKRASDGAKPLHPEVVSRLHRRSDKNPVSLKRSAASFLSQQLQLVGFSSPADGLFQCVKEFTDNSIDACLSLLKTSDANELHPRSKITISISPVSDSNAPASTRRRDRVKAYKVAVGDTGKGIESLERVRELFGTVFSSSKSNGLEQTAGTFGVAIKSAILYSLSTRPLTSGVMSVITSSSKSCELISCDLTMKSHQAEFMSESVQTSPQYFGVSGTKVSLAILGDLDQALPKIKAYFSALGLLNLPISFSIDIVSPTAGPVLIPAPYVEIQNYPPPGSQGMRVLSAFKAKLSLKDNQCAFEECIWTTGNHGEFLQGKVIVVVGFITRKNPIIWNAKSTAAAGKEKLKLELLKTDKAMQPDDSFKTIASDVNAFNNAGDKRDVIIYRFCNSTPLIASAGSQDCDILKKVLNSAMWCKLGLKPGKTFRIQNGIVKLKVATTSQHHKILQFERIILAVHYQDHKIHYKSLKKMGVEFSCQKKIMAVDKCFSAALFSLKAKAPLVFESKREQDKRLMETRYIPSIATSLCSMLRSSSNPDFVSQCMDILDVESLEGVQEQLCQLFLRLSSGHYQRNQLNENQARNSAAKPERQSPAKKEHDNDMYVAEEMPLLSDADLEGLV